MEAPRVTRVSNIFSFTWGGCSKPGICIWYGLAWHSNKSHRVWWRAWHMYMIWPRDTRDRKVEHESHRWCDWHDGLPWTHTDGRDDRGRYCVLGSCNHLAKLRDVFLSGSFRINCNWTPHYEQKSKYVSLWITIVDDNTMSLIQLRVIPRET